MTITSDPFSASLCVSALPDFRSAVLRLLPCVICFGDWAFAFAGLSAEYVRMLLQGKNGEDGEGG